MSQVLGLLVHMGPRWEAEMNGAIVEISRSSCAFPALQHVVLLHTLKTLTAHNNRYATPNYWCAATQVHFFNHNWKHNNANDNNELPIYTEVGWCYLLITTVHTAKTTCQAVERKQARNEKRNTTARTLQAPGSHLLCQLCSVSLFIFLLVYFQKTVTLYN